MQTEVLLLDSLSPDAVHWLAQRYRVMRRSVEQLDRGDDETLAALAAARAVVLHPSTLLNGAFLQRARGLEVVGRLAGGTSNTDHSACQDQGVTVLNSARATVHSNVEFMITSLLSLQRPALWRGLQGAAMSDGAAARFSGPKGHELYRSVVGVLGLGPVAMSMAPVLQALGARLVGYDPAVHSSAEIWQKLNIYPLPLAGVLSTADSVTVHMMYASRFKHFINEHVLSHCKRGQVWVSSSRSALFDGAALLEALTDGRIASCLIDSGEVELGGVTSELMKLPNFFLTPRLGGQTVQAHEKASWYLAHRIDTALQAGNGFVDDLDGVHTGPGSLSESSDLVDPVSSEADPLAVTMPMRGRRN